METNQTFDCVRPLQIFCESSIVFDYRAQSRDWVRLGSISNVGYIFNMQLEAKLAEAEEELDELEGRAEDADE